MFKTISRAVLVVTASALLVSACGGDSSTPRVLSVPSEYASIQDAVNDARAGDIVEIGPGRYTESVTVASNGIVIQGLDRNTVVLDGQHRLPNGILVSANNVSIQNLTVHSFTQNGIVFNGIQAATKGKAVDPQVVYGTDGKWIDEYHVSHVTSYNNGLYGIYAFASTNGVIEDSFVSGHPDSGVYVGQCNPCNSIIQRVTAEVNAIGYYGTNASGNVYVINSTFRNNRIGIAPNSQDAEKLAPQRETYVVGNRVLTNNNSDAPHVPDGAFGLGIAVGGGTQNVVMRNLVTGNVVAGIAVMSLGRYQPEGNRIEGNVATGNGVDLALANIDSSQSRGNCFVGNTFATSLPQGIEKALLCDGQDRTVAIASLPTVNVPPTVDYRTIPAPPKQTTMTDAQLIQFRTPTKYLQPDVASIKVPN